jgi:DNA-binding transcriptional MocR family regulator
VALAYDALSGEGLVESVVGRGTFVCSRIPSPMSREPLRIPLDSRVEDLLAFEGARPRYGDGKNLVCLHSLIPDPALYPFDAFRRCFNRVLSQSGPELFLYGSSQGHAGLRSALAERFAKSGIEISADDLVLCHGSSQGIAMAVRLFAGSGDAVAVEAPTYHNVLATLVALGVEAAPVPMREEGADLEALERTLSRPEVKAFYTIPSFHNPMGTTTGIAHRRRLLEVAARCAKPVLEDAFEMDLHQSTRTVPPLAGLDENGLVLHLYSFSKSLFPGVRVGCIAARGRAVEGLLALKRASDLSDSLLMQAALEEFLHSGGYDRHLNRMRRILRQRRDALLAALEEEMPPGASWTRPEGGYQVWVELPFEVDTRDLLADAARAGVLFAPGSNFLHDRRASRGLRLTLAQADESAIRRGVAALGRVVRERLNAEPRAREDARVHL